MSARPPSSDPLKWTTSPCTSKAFASMMLSASFRMSSWPGWSVAGSRPGGGVALGLPHLFFQRADLLLRLGQGLDEPLVLPLGLLELLPALLQARPQQLELPRHLLEPAADLVQLLLEPLHLGLEGVDLGVGFFFVPHARSFLNSPACSSPPRTDKLVYRTLTPDCNSHTMMRRIRKVNPRPTPVAAGPRASSTPHGRRLMS